MSFMGEVDSLQVSTLTTTIFEFESSGHPGEASCTLVIKMSVVCILKMSLQFGDMKVKLILPAVRLFQSLWPQHSRNCLWRIKCTEGWVQLPFAKMGILCIGEVGGFSI